MANFLIEFPEGCGISSQFYFRMITIGECVQRSTIPITQDHIVNQFNLKVLILTVAAPLLMLMAVAEPASAKIDCVKLSSKPPIVNNLTHVSNVIWRNKRSHCQYQKVIENLSSTSASK